MVIAGLHREAAHATALNVVASVMFPANVRQFVGCLPGGGPITVRGVRGARVAGMDETKTSALTLCSKVLQCGGVPKAAISPKTTDLP
jgi:hypothetical protein